MFGGIHNWARRIWSSFSQPEPVAESQRNTEYNTDEYVAPSPRTAAPVIDMVAVKRVINTLTGGLKKFQNENDVVWNLSIESNQLSETQLLALKQELERERDESPRLFNSWFKKNKRMLLNLLTEANQGNFIEVFYYYPGLITKLIKSGADPSQIRSQSFAEYPEMLDAAIEKLGQAKKDEILGLVVKQKKWRWFNLDRVNVTISKLLKSGADASQLENDQLLSDFKLLEAALPKLDPERKNALLQLAVEEKLKRPYDAVLISKYDAIVGMIKSGAGVSKLSERFYRIKRVAERRRELMNQPVTAENIHARSTQKLGEFGSANITGRVDRMKSNIDMIGHLANERHRQSNFHQDADGKWVVNDDKRNAITRLVTDEFAFYPSETPMSLKEFHDLYAHVEDLAGKLSPNLTLILASFPVLSNDGLIHNVTIHLQCGPVPSLHAFAKTTKSPVDPEYEGYQTAKANMSYSKQAAPLVTEAFSKNSVVPCRTAGGAEYFDAIDVCSDHHHGIAKRNLEEQVREQALNTRLGLVPRQVSHILTSSSISPQVQQQIGNMLFHADPSIDIFSPNQKIRHQQLDDAQLRQLQAVLPPGLTQISRGQSTDVLKVASPGFGPDLELSFMTPHQLDALPAQFVSAIEEALSS